MPRAFLVKKRERDSSSQPQPTMSSTTVASVVPDQEMTHVAKRARLGPVMDSPYGDRSPTIYPNLSAGMYRPNLGDKSRIPSHGFNLQDAFYPGFHLLELSTQRNRCHIFENLYNRSQEFVDSLSGRSPHFKSGHFAPSAHQLTPDVTRREIRSPEVEKNWQKNSDLDCDAAEHAVDMTGYSSSDSFVGSGSEYGSTDNREIQVAHSRSHSPDSRCESPILDVVNDSDSEEESGEIRRDGFVQRAHSTTPENTGDVRRRQSAEAAAGCGEQEPAPRGHGAGVADWERRGSPPGAVAARARGERRDRAAAAREGDGSPEPLALTCRPHMSAAAGAAAGVRGAPVHPSPKFNDPRLWLQSLPPSLSQYYLSMPPLTRSSGGHPQNVTPSTAHTTLTPSTRHPLPSPPSPPPIASREKSAFRPTAAATAAAAAAAAAATAAAARNIHLSSMLGAHMQSSTPLRHPMNLPFFPLSRGHPMMSPCAPSALGLTPGRHPGFPGFPSPAMGLVSSRSSNGTPSPDKITDSSPNSDKDSMGSPTGSLPWMLDPCSTASEKPSPPGHWGETPTGKPGASRRPNEPPRYQCDDCKKSYATFSGLSKHKQFHCEAQIKKEFSCKYCDKTYTSLGALKMHIRTHTLPCKCQICGKAFSRPWLLQGHIRTHTGEKPFICPHCGRSFADRSNLRAHLQTHSDVKKYSCKTCAKTFSRMSLLLKHEESSCPGLRPSLTLPM